MAQGWHSEEIRIGVQPSFCFCLEESLMPPLPGLGDFAGGADIAFYVGAR
jgi:hypothetical protein